MENFYNNIKFIFFAHLPSYELTTQCLLKPNNIYRATLKFSIQKEKEKERKTLNNNLSHIN